ncbi:MAG: nucleoside-triphosphatase [candidate division KSB1 bacterium]|nr:nucleoside-triphosphatase [candidate division KSB1 bacterium]MDZ7376532.1 nucleoside-triphosphatase [candidate division KSB1 bacterium]
MKITNIFVTGAIHCGKTTILNRVIAFFPELKIGGFRTVPIIEHGVKKGFILESLSGESKTFAHVELNTNNLFDIYRYNISIFEDFGATCLAEALANSDLILMDEIGLMERDAHHFCQMILRCLNSKRIVLGAYQKRASWFAQMLRFRADTHVFEVTIANREQIPGQIISLLKE